MLVEIITIIRFIVMITMSLLTLILELPLKFLCGILSIILLFIIAIIAPIVNNTPDKLIKILRNFFNYGLKLKNWFFVKVYNIYDKALQL